MRFRVPHQTVWGLQPSRGGYVAGYEGESDFCCNAAKWHGFCFDFHMVVTKVGQEAADLHQSRMLRMRLNHCWEHFSYIRFGWNTEELEK
jgi:hypothetical protein